ncbi:MAG: hypothetical protein FH748_05295 [Balneolaceae bacterium]|nr:hypothetical protein [Balneolaceae bacterium]
MQTVRGFIISLILVLSAGQGYAQPHSFTFTEYTVHNTELSHNTVTSLFMDSRGFLWVGTINGLNRFDGKHIKVYRHNSTDSTSLSNDFIHGISEDKEGFLWITTRDGGINRFDPVSETFVHFKYSETADNGIPNSPVYLSHTDQQNTFWVSFGRETLGILNKETGKFKKGEILNKKSGERLASPNAVTEFNNGGWLAVSFDGLYFLPDSTLQAFIKTPSREKLYARQLNHPAIQKSKNLVQIYTIKDKGSWIRGGGSPVVGISEEDYPDYLRDVADEGVYKNSAEDWFAQREQYLYTGAGEPGIAVINTETNKISYHKPVDETSEIGVNTLYEDKHGGLWGFSWGNGFARLKEQKLFRLINAMNYPQLPTEFMLAFEEEPGKGVWLGTAAGVGFWDISRNRLTNVNRYLPGEELTSVWSMDRDENGLWIVTLNRGLWYLPIVDGKPQFDNLQTFKPANSFVKSYNLHQVKRDSRGWLWVGYEGEGIQLIKDPDRLLNGNPVHAIEFNNPETSQHIKGNQIREIYEDKEGNIWLAMMQSGFNKITIGKNEIVEITNLSHNAGNTNSISFNDGRSIFQQNDSTYWFATYGGGINRWNKYTGKILQLDEKDGLANNSTYGILPDANPDYIWISTNNGLSRLNTRTLRFTNYTENDGLQNREFNTGAFYKMSDGKLIYGGIGGLNVVYTEKLEPSDTASPVYITQVNLFNEPLPSDTSHLFLDKLTLPYNKNFLSFEYVSLEYDNPSEVEYAYKMDQVDEAWVTAGNRTYAGYPGLEPGEYIFRVKSADGDGVWNEKASTIQVVITPPWWQTIWFRLTMGVLLVVSFASGIRYLSQRRLRKQIRQMEMENKLRNERERISRDLHDHVGAQLANIISGLSLADKYNQVEEKGKSSKLMNSLKSDAQVTIKQLRETIWALNQNKISLEGFIQHLKTYFGNQSTLHESLNINYELQADEDIELSATQALNIFRVIQEASQNTLKYADAENLKISLIKENGQLNVAIKDDGTFKEKNNQQNGGYGLGNMKKRAEELDGTLDIATGNGTKITLTIKV